MQDERPDDTLRPDQTAPIDADEHGHDEHGHDEHGHDEHGHDEHEHEHGHGDSHPAIRRLHAELEAARDGMTSITRLALPYRQRVVDAIRTGLPDVAGRSAHEAGAEATVAELRRFGDLGIAHSDEARPVVELWSEIIGTATEAASAVR